MLNEVKIQKQLTWLTEQIKCLKSVACVCEFEETSLSFDSDTKRLSATFVDGSTRYVTIDIEGGGGGSEVSWEVITEDQVLVSGKRYLTNNVIKLELILPQNNAVNTIKVASRRGGWKILIPPSWKVELVDEIVEESIESTLDTDSIEFLSLGNNTYLVTNLIGNVIFNN
jgi:hypothetical protein